MEKEREGLKQEIQNLNDDVINTLVEERGEILERETELQESRKKIKELEDERLSLKNEIKNHKGDQQPYYRTGRNFGKSQGIPYGTRGVSEKRNRIGRRTIPSEERQVQSRNQL